MLHGLTVQSCTSLLRVLHTQLEKPVEVTDIVKPIPEDVEEQEKILQVCTPGSPSGERTSRAHLDRLLVTSSSSYCMYIAVVYVTQFRVLYITSYIPTQSPALPVLFSIFEKWRETVVVYDGHIYCQYTILCLVV